MILKGSQRSGAKQLAGHLLNDRDNDHVSVVEVRGFVADDLHGALAEAYAVSRGTQCKQFMFSLSLNPPKGAETGEEDFRRAADEAEKRLGLEGQPRAIIIHEKEGRRHAHVVWSRIDPDAMRAVNLSHFKNKLTALSRELYLENGWSLPDGLREHGGKSPLSFTLAEWQQARRLGLDPREIKDVFREAWTQSDSAKAFAAALEERGYFLAKGDRRGFVALDVEGNVFSVPKYLGMKTGEVRRKFGDGETLRELTDVRSAVAEQVTAKLKGFVAEAKAAQAQDLRQLVARRDEQRSDHRAERERLKFMQAERWRQETDARAQRLRKGLGGFVDMLSGKAAEIKSRNRIEAFEGLRRDQAQRDQLVFDQMRERRTLQERIDKMRLRHVQERKALNRDAIRFLHASRDPNAPERRIDGDGPHRRPRRRGVTHEL